ncbi:MAG: 30S ribosomal protein S11 [Candidatus Wildermuthbacteria bacterium]|nr:30S ribosomal protein S11 [Candidatus Wildermuthbacteria bacterium]
MGKKRIIRKSGEELVEERKGVDEKVSAQTGAVPSRVAIKEGRVYVYSSYNNTLISLTDTQGRVLSQVSAGKIGFKGTKKSTPFAASKVAETIAQMIANKGIERVHVFIKGIGPGRDSALRALGARNFEIISIADITPVPHNGPKAPRLRRV